MGDGVGAQLDDNGLKNLYAALRLPQSYPPVVNRLPVGVRGLQNSKNLVSKLCTRSRQGAAGIADVLGCNTAGLESCDGFDSDRRDNILQCRLRLGELF